MSIAQKKCDHFNYEEDSSVNDMVVKNQHLVY